MTGKFRVTIDECGPDGEWKNLGATLFNEEQAAWLALIINGVDPVNFVALPPDARQRVWEKAVEGHPMAVALN